jgi:hypothetical protein
MADKGKFSSANLPEPRRGFVVVQGKLQDAPSHVLTHKTILWPPGMPEKKPGEPVRYFTPDDIYRRVHLVEENVYAYVPDKQDADAAVEVVRQKVRQVLGLN